MDTDEQYDLQKAHEHTETYRRYERKPKQAKDLLSQLISRRGFTHEQFNEELQKAWQSVTGKRFAGKTLATVIKRGSLEVLVESSPAMQQLAFDKAGLLKKIQKELPDAKIKSLRFKVGQVRR